MSLARRLAGWRRQRAPDGAFLLHPAGLDVGQIRIRERVRPLRPLRAYVDELLAASSPAFRTQAVATAPERFTTVEGELGSWLSLAAPGLRAERTVALIEADDFATIIDGAFLGDVELPSLRELVVTLARGYFLGLGEVRVRRYGYAPPQGWTQREAPRASVWHHPRYPSRPSTITVFDARPVSRSLPDGVDRLVYVDADLCAVQQGPPLAITSATGLRGQLSRSNGRRADREVALVDARLVDSRFAYQARLEVDAVDLPEDLPVFRGVVDTIEALPAPGGSDPVDADRWGSHWAE